MPEVNDHVNGVSQQAKIGPNALTQTVRALREVGDEAQLVAVLRQCGQEYLLQETITEMVDEQAFADLVTALTKQLGLSQAQQVLQRSGQLTADYLLVHRIPRLFQWLLRVMPRRMRLKLLLVAISGHAWTFVGSGNFQYDISDTPQLSVVTQLHPAEAVCSFYRGTFNQLFRKLIDARAQLEMTIVYQDGRANCVYSIQYIALNHLRAVTMISLV